jgi:uncharacterized protein with HEPN domain
MSRDLESLIDIQNAAQRIKRYVDGISRSELDANDEKLSAILYQITIVGEATKRLSPDFCTQHPEVPWREMAGMRDVIVHEYDQLDLEVIWDVVSHKLDEYSVLSSIYPKVREIASPFPQRRAIALISPPKATLKT